MFFVAQKIVSDMYRDSLHIVFCVGIFITLRAKLSGAVYCYRSCLWRAGGRAVFVSLLPRKLEIACIDPRQTGFVCKICDHLQLIKFWPSRAPGRGSAAGRKCLGPSYYRKHAVFASLWALFYFIFDSMSLCYVDLSFCRDSQRIVNVIIFLIRNEREHGNPPTTCPKVTRSY